MLYNMSNVMLYNICHVMLYNMCHVTLYNMCHVMLYNVSCYVTGFICALVIQLTLCECVKRKTRA